MTLSFNQFNAGTIRAKLRAQVEAGTLTRNQIELRTVATLRKALPHGRKGAVNVNTARARFNREMVALGVDMMTAHQAFSDCYAMAELENMAEA